MFALQEATGHVVLGRTRAPKFPQSVISQDHGYSGTCDTGTTFRPFEKLRYRHRVSIPKFRRDTTLDDNHHHSELEK